MYFCKTKLLLSILEIKKLELPTLFWENISISMMNLSKNNKPSWRNLKGKKTKFKYNYLMNLIWEWTNYKDKVPNLKVLLPIIKQYLLPQIVHQFLTYSNLERVLKKIYKKHPLWIHYFYFHSSSDNWWKKNKKFSSSINLMSWHLWGSYKKMKWFWLVYGF